jgi:hypothetical protein
MDPQEDDGAHRPEQPEVVETRQLIQSLRRGLEDYSGLVTYKTWELRYIERACLKKGRIFFS